MHSIRIQLLAFITAVLLIFLVILNIYPLTSSRDLIFEEKRSAISGQAAVVDPMAAGTDKMATLEQAIARASVDSPTVTTGDQDLRSIEVALNGLLRQMPSSKRGRALPWLPFQSRGRSSLH